MILSEKQTSKYSPRVNAVRNHPSREIVWKSLIERNYKNRTPWLSVHKAALVSRIKIPYAFVKKPRKATALLHFLTSA